LWQGDDAQAEAAKAIHTNETAHANE
jgi:hypothetical protein